MSSLPAPEPLLAPVETPDRLIARAAVGEALAGFSHSLKNVLGALQGGSYLVDSGLEQKDLERIQEGWAMVKKGNRFLRDLASKMLVFSREKNLACETLEAEELIASVVSIMHPQAQAQGVVLTTHLDPALPFIVGDPICLRECLLNLVANAIEACEPGAGQVEMVTAASTNGRFHIAVRDNGRGVAREDREQLFQPFFTTKGRENMGLGLAVTQKIIREHQGEIRVESSPGQGTCFLLDLPLEPAAQ